MHVSDSINEINANGFHYDLHAKNRARQRVSVCCMRCKVCVSCIDRRHNLTNEPIAGMKRNVTANNKNNTEIERKLTVSRDRVYVFVCERQSLLYRKHTFEYSIYRCTVWAVYVHTAVCLKLIQLYKLFPWKWLFVKLMDFICTYISYVWWMVCITRVTSVFATWMHRTDPSQQKKTHHANLCPSLEPHHNPKNFSAFHFATEKKTN